MLRRLALLTAALSAAAPAAAQAAPFKDRVLPAGEGRPTARAAQSPASVTVPLTDGGQIRVSFTPAVGSQPALAQQYVAFLESLPHSTELGELDVKIATAEELPGMCGDDGKGEGTVLGCYGSDEMIVPSTGLDTPAADGAYTVRYIITHEYGHHIAAHRSNALGAGGALNYGPKYWASYELVCNQTIDKKLFPTAQTDFTRYLANPGEAWAEAYARLVYPEQPWTWTELLKPDAVAMEAVRRDVYEPWSKNTSQTFTMAAGRNTQTFAVPLTLDGALKATVKGPKGSEVGVRIKSTDQDVGRSKRKGATDVWSLTAGCREQPTETLSFIVKRTGGESGPVSLRVSYPG